MAKQYIIKVDATVRVEYVVESKEKFTDPREAFDKGELVDETPLGTIDLDWQTAQMEIDE